MLGISRGRRKSNVGEWYMIEEQWRSVIGFEKLYEISNFGRIFSLGITYAGRGGILVTKKSKLLKTFLDKNGYWIVTLRKNDKYYTRFVHRLIAEAFLPNYNGCLEVNHKDLNPKNCHIDNLEWCTRRQNIDHAISFGAFSPVRNPNMSQKLTAGDVIRIHEIRTTGLSHAKIAKKFGVCEHMIKKILDGASWKELHPNYRKSA